MNVTEASGQDRSTTTHNAHLETCRKANAVPFLRGRRRRCRVKPLGTCSWMEGRARTAAWPSGSRSSRIVPCRARWAGHLRHLVREDRRRRGGGVAGAPTRRRRVRGLSPSAVQESEGRPERETPHVSSASLDHESES